jgi:hypothetical protein
VRVRAVYGAHTVSGEVCGFELGFGLGFRQAAERMIAGHSKTP